MARQQQLVNRRIRLLLFLLVLAFGVVLVRAAWIQAVEARSLAARAQSQQQVTVALQASRGTIYDRLGTQLALGEQATTVYANPMQIRNPKHAAAVAGRVLGIDPALLLPKLSDRSHGFVYVARQADPGRAATLAQKHLLGFGFMPAQRRTYPQRSVAAQLLGFVGVDGKGLSGLEYRLDDVLRGRDGSETILRDPAGSTIDVVRHTAPTQGRDVYLTIDHTIQANAEQVLRATVARWRAKSATAIVLDPRSGKVLAMAVVPSYDANGFATTPPELQKLRAVTDMYEPGSTFKVVTVAGALSEGVVTPATRFTLPYSIHVADRTIHDADPRGTETMSVAEILARSSNVGAITIAREKLGQHRLAQWIARFGFGRRTGIDYPGESSGIALPEDKWSGSTIGNVPIGQGVSVTAVQMASVYAALANKGMWIEPHLVDRLQGSQPIVPRRRRILSRRVDAQLMSMLRGVVVAGTGQTAAIPGYLVAGKTGTAQVPDGRGGYADGKYIASFVGIVPASRPRLVVLVKVDEPHGGIFGAEVAAPAFQQIASAALQYLEIPPDAPASG